ncbi:uncharacterized protein LOC135486946 [Lineus longissimus]|uniref:uncharacterized protein LOC135486946 n=1 Tax=Lineus longissimus TaxID=88925 RepID=UPI002B4E5CA4
MKIVAILLLAALSVASPCTHEDFLNKRKAVSKLFENAIGEKIDAVANAEVKEALSGMKKRYVAAFNNALLDNYRQVRQVIKSNNNRRSVSQEVHIENVKRAFDDMKAKVHLQATRGIWDNVKAKFSDFGSWAKSFLGDVWVLIKPSLVELKDMAIQLIKDGASELSEHAKNEAMEFFKKHADQLKDDMKEKISNTLGTGDTLK